MRDDFLSLCVDPHGWQEAGRFVAAKQWRGVSGRTQRAGRARM